MNNLVNITTKFYDKLGQPFDRLDVQSRYQGSSKSNTKQTDSNGLFIFQASPNRTVEILAKPPSQKEYTVFKIINSSVLSSEANPLKVQLPKTLDEYKQVKPVPAKGVVATLFRVLDSNGKVMENFPVQSRPKGKTNAYERYTNEKGIVEVLSSPSRDIEILVLTSKDEFILKSSINSGNGIENPILIQLDEAYDSFKGITLIKILDRLGNHYVIDDTAVEMIFDNNQKQILKVREGKLKLYNWVGQKIKLTVYKPDGKPLDSVTFTVKRVKAEFVDLQLDVDVLNGKTATDEPSITRKIEDTNNINIKWDEAALGKLSEQYETGGRGAITVSGGVGDAGGVSYGSFQMTSKTSIKQKDGSVRVVIGGRVKEFTESPEFPWKEEFKNLVPGTQEFTKKWKEIVQREGEKFKKVEHDFIKRTHYEVTIRNTIKAHNLDLKQHSHTLNDVIWSTSVHNGPDNPIINRAISNLGDTPVNTKIYDEKLIKEIYKERGKRRADGKLAYFSKNSKKVQDGVAARFVSEELKALKALKNEK
ncbi:VgrG-related protein [Acinetobacter courvalinii]|uniref:VgrG-related protein n=1 Tax=Acinetobacter courvalinii TaxID=280147 RepID=UPI0021D0E536|nr:hypothetical protein [Acinetobacter courvalinii]MCU4641922.1 hypothetical protein [Acinetobacter courvalinii]